MNKTEFLTGITPIISQIEPILSRNNNTDNIREAISTSQTDNNIVKFLTFSEYEKYRDMVNFLLNDAVISRKYSKIFVEKNITNFLHELLSSPENKDNLLNSMFDVFNTNSNEYLVISEIENIRVLDDGNYRLLDSNIKKLADLDAPFIMGSILLSDNSTNPIGKPCVITTVSAGDQDKAKDLAMFNFITSFNLLRLYAPNFKPSLKGNLISGNIALITHNKTKNNTTYGMSRTGDLLLNHAYIDAHLYEQLVVAGISDIEQDNQINKIVKECLYWFGNGLDEENASAKLLNFVTILESTLKKKDEQIELRKSVSERGALLLYDDFESRKKGLAQLKKIYDARSKVVHTGALVDDLDTANLAGGYAKAVLIKLIKNCGRLDGNFNKFIEELDDKKLK